MSAAQPSELKIKLSSLAGYHLATVSGPIDFSTHRYLAEQLNRALLDTRIALIVDLAQVDFCDSSGLNTLTHAMRDTHTRGLTLVLIGVRDRVARVFALTRLNEAFDIKPDLETAIRWLENGTSAQDAS